MLVLLDGRHDGPKRPLPMPPLLDEAAPWLRLEDEVQLKATDKAAGSGVLRRARSGTRLTVANLVELMIQRSDNTDSNYSLGWTMAAQSWGTINAGQTPLP